LKIDLRLGLQRAGQLIYAVPGWPEAPFRLCLRRALPILIPCLGLLGIAGWELGVEQPRQRAVRAANAPLVAAEEEITALQLKWSERQATALAVEAARVSRALLPSPAAVPAALDGLAAAAAALNWRANFHAATAAAPEIAPGSPIGFVLARGRLEPFPENEHPFASLLAFVEQFGTDEKGIDLTRLAIRADEEGRYSVEATLRLAYGISP
jgi:hypothetical protein